MMNLKQLMAITLSLALIQPGNLYAASVDTSSPRSIIGSITSNGSVQVGEIPVPSVSTLFSGDQVTTTAGNAVIQYRQGPRVILGGASQASFTDGQVQLHRGQMAFESSGRPVGFSISTLKVEPTTSNSAVNVTVEDNLATVAVSEGSVRVVDPSGTELVALNKGDARLFEKASSIPAPAPPPAPSAAAAQSGGGNNSWLVALAVGVVGVSLGVAGLLRANSAEDAADEARSQNAALQTQAASLQAQITALRNNAAAANLDLQALSIALANLTAIQGQLASIGNQINALLTAIAGQNGVATAAQLTQLRNLQTQQQGLQAQLQTVLNQVNDAARELNRQLSGS